MADLTEVDARIDAFTAEAGTEMYTAAAAPVPEPQGVGVTQPGGMPAIHGGWHANAERIERMKGPAGGIWKWSWDKAAEFMALPESIEYELDGKPRRIECRVTAEEASHVGEKLAQLLDAMLPASFGMNTENSRIGTIFMCLGAIAIIAKFKLKTLNEASAVVAAYRQKQDENGGDRGKE